MIRDLPIAAVHPNPDQPRKEFEPAALHELAASIREHGLIQPVRVTPRGEGFMLIAGERRFRAHQLAGIETIRAEVVEVDDQVRDEQAIVENLQRADITPLEEAQAFQRMLDLYDLTEDELAKRLGIKQPWRIGERTSLLRLQEKYRELLRKGHLPPYTATQMARLDHRGQDVVFKAVKAGRLPTWADVKAAADGILEAATQTSFLDDPGPSTEDRKAASSFENRMQSVARMLNAGIRDNEVTAVRKVDPGRADTLADMCAQMVKDLKRIEKALRQAAVQADLTRE